MNWELRVYKPIGGPHVPGSLIASYTPSSPGGIVGEMRWTRRPDGDCVQLEWEAVPSLVDIPPRAIVQLLIDGTPMWYGVAVRTWPKRETRVRRYTALGGKHLLRAKYFAKIWASGGDTGTIAGEIIANYRHPSLQAGSVSASGFSLTYLSVPGVDVATVLDRLTQVTPGTTWGVDATGTIYWGRVSRIAQIAGVNLRNLPVVSEQVWDVVHFVPPPPSGGLLTYVVGSEFGAERAFLIDESFLERLTPQSILSHPDTWYAYSTNGGSSWTQVPDLNPYIGFLYDNFDTTILRASPTWMPGKGWLGMRFARPIVKVYLKTLNGSLADEYFIAIKDAPSYTSLRWNITIPPTEWWIAIPIIGTDIFVTSAETPAKGGSTYEALVVEARALGVKDLSGVAKALVRTPYLEPTEFLERGIIEPATTVILQEAEASVSPVEWEYTLSPEGGAQTRIRVGTPASQEDAVASSVYLAASALDDNLAANIRMGMTERPV